MACLATGCDVRKYDVREYDASEASHAEQLLMQKGRRKLGVHCWKRQGNKIEPMPLTLLNLMTKQL